MRFVYPFSPADIGFIPLFEFANLFHCYIFLCGILYKFHNTVFHFINFVLYCVWFTFYAIYWDLCFFQGLYFSYFGFLINFLFYFHLFFARIHLFLFCNHLLFLIDSISVIISWRMLKIFIFKPNLSFNQHAWSTLLCSFFCSIYQLRNTLYTLLCPAPCPNPGHGLLSVLMSARPAPRTVPGKEELPKARWLISEWIGLC